MIIDNVRICQFREETLAEREARVINRFVDTWKREDKESKAKKAEDVYGRTVSDLACGDNGLVKDSYSMKIFRELYAARPCRRSSLTTKEEMEEQRNPEGFFA